MAARRTKVAFITCSGGSLMEAIVEAARSGVVGAECVGVVTDRPCKAECAAVRAGMEWRRVIGAERTEAWSERVKAVLEDWGAEVVVLLFLRKVGRGVWGDSRWRTWNVHPSLLPAFKGIGALEANYEAAREGRTEWMGVTLHAVNDELDGGRIMGQARYGLEEAGSIEQARHASFLFKLILVVEGVRRIDWGEMADKREEATWRGRYRGFAPNEEVSAWVQGRWAQEWAKGMMGAAGAEVSS